VFGFEYSKGFHRPDDMFDLSLTQTTYVLGQAAVASLAAAAIIEAKRKRFDLFGMVLIAISAALGGGSLRDLLLARPVFWVADQTYLMTALFAALLTFFSLRRRQAPVRLFLVTDALGLALFTVVGTRVALDLETPWLPASFLGVVTGVMGGILRDVLCNEEPLVFRGRLYATAAWAGARVYVVLVTSGLSGQVSALCAGTTILVVRWAALRWSWQLPSF
jgi:uncharacterized membrane protein YeiH